MTLGTKQLQIRRLNAQERARALPKGEALVAAVRVAITQIAAGRFTAKTVARQVLRRTAQGAPGAEVLARVRPVLEAMRDAGEIVGVPGFPGQFRSRSPRPEPVPDLHRSTACEGANTASRGGGSAPANRAAESATTEAGEEKLYGAPGNAYVRQRLRRAIDEVLNDAEGPRCFSVRQLLPRLLAMWDAAGQERPDPEFFHKWVCELVRGLVQAGELRVLVHRFGPRGKVFTGVGETFADVVAPPVEPLPASSPLRPPIASAFQPGQKRISPERAERLRLLEHRRKRLEALERERAAGAGAGAVGGGRPAAEAAGFAGELGEARPRSKRAGDVIPINPMRLSAHDPTPSLDVTGVRLHPPCVGRGNRKQGGQRGQGCGDARHHRRWANDKAGGKAKPNTRAERRAEVEALFASARADAEEEEE